MQQTPTGGVSEEEPFPPVTAELLSSSYIPSEVEVSQIQLLLKAVELRLDGFNVEKLSTVQKQRDNLQDVRDQYRAVVSPTRRLPVEILLQIFFLACVPGLSLVGDEEVMAPALDISQICSFWRQIALGCTEIWSNLSVNIFCGPGSRNAQVVDLYLLNSQSSPLRLHITAQRDLGDDDWRWVSREDLIRSDRTILNSLLKEAHRWSTVSFELFNDILFSAGPSCEIWEPLGEHPELQCLTSLFVVWDTEYDDPDADYHFFMQAPNLQSLEATSLQYNLIASHSNLQSLKLDQPIWFPPDAIWLFRTCTSLKDIQFSGDLNDEDPEVEDDPILTPISCDELDSLRYLYYGGNVTPLLISILILPSLTILDLTVSQSNLTLRTRHSMSQELRQMLQRSGCQLSVLRLSDALFLSAKDLIELIALTPTVVDFTICPDMEDSEVFTKNLFQSLSFNLDSNVLMTSRSLTNPFMLLPRLKCFSLVTHHHSATQNSTRQTDSSLPHLDSENIYTMIHSRRYPPNDNANDVLEKLEQFHLSVYLGSTQARRRTWLDTFSSSLEPHLRGLEREGLELTLKVQIW
ncbi:hypothetical protein D9758_013329 [Tetrapyrgos nigripes]|uniref:F-box domain-containing protein n=1 Tax=Tetrapyrgos nigripes TaxID=182062 RepID=A0A8H5CCF8_9AGAR|nr:hypothetical protein D9758_013329 [Tetrapyrgos nigripes]